MNYIMMTFYNRGSEESPIWEVYGIRSEFNNDHIGTYHSESEAMVKAHEFILPVMRGMTNGIEQSKAIRALSSTTV